MVTTGSHPSLDGLRSASEADQRVSYALSFRPLAAAASKVTGQNRPFDWNRYFVYCVDGARSCRAKMKLFQRSTRGQEIVMPCSPIRPARAEDATELTQLAVGATEHAGYDADVIARLMPVLKIKSSRRRPLRLLTRGDPAPVSLLTLGLPQADRSNASASSSNCDLSGFNTAATKAGRCGGPCAGPPRRD